MPIYAFQCSQCGHRFDRLQKLSDPDPEACPQCGTASVKRQVTAPVFRLAGSGWYETDFKKVGDKKQNLAGSSGEGGGDGASASAKTESGAGISESKPAAASDGGAGSNSVSKE